MKTAEKYNPSEIEGKWQKIWEEKGIYQPDLQNAKKPYYNLMMFPYPSAEGLHVGNMYAFTGADINGRYQRMKGYDVFEPIGLDGFGIHSENYAIKIGKHPAEQAKISEKNFYRQLHAIGNGFAWKNKLETYDPNYYKWTQWIFVQMFKAGLAYRRKSPVNFCPSCKTVLSDEQVIDGRCERCKSLVEKRDMEQWFFKITAYAEKLLKNIESLDWTNKVKVGQRNWIGKKEGINITYPVVDSSGRSITRSDLVSERKDNPITITCFTTRPDTNFGATFIVVGPEHPFATLLCRSNSKLKTQNLRLKEIKDYIDKAKNKSETERIAEGRKKTGVFTGFYAVNQLNNYRMPIWISDFVLGNVGTGAVVGVPGHDMRDFEFAKEFNLPIIRVVIGKDGDKSEITRPQQVQEEEGRMINSGFLDGMETRKAIPAMMDHLEKKGWGKRVVTYKLRDWCISRQRYWGAPIPMVYCQLCAQKNIGWLSVHKTLTKVPKAKTPFDTSNLMPGWYPVPEDQLPVLLPPDVKDWKPEGTGKGPLAKISSFVNTKCPKCGRDAKRETDVCDTFLDSSWYHMRYPSVHLSNLNDLGNLPWDPAITKKWLPVTQYIGGAEHTVLHLLYARFVAMVFKDLGMIDFEEPYTRFYAHGLIIAEGAKMSKSRGNIVNPDEYIKKYGADTLRTYLMFLGPFDAGGDFRDTGIAGMYRFLSRVWRLVNGFLKVPKEGKVSKVPKGKLALDTSGTFPAFDTFTRTMHRTIKEVTEDMENFRYNTAIAHIMEYVNQLTDNRQQITRENVQTLLLLLAPFAPHMTEELWQTLRHLGSRRPSLRGHDSPDGGGNSKHFSIHLTPWPSFDSKYLVEPEVTIIVQINGKTRDVIKVALKHLGGSRMDSPEVEEIVVVLAKKSEKVQKYLEGKTIKKTIFVPGKLLNFVV